eukprot:CAMPEP_0174942106 /NCGR_PEP_ID=MMETSP1355-20121228/73425_1 /TAXON_ID=464990 /ORGANISM="Hemiselmis tepida, Strain CCMP443" /LENGTH=85 /DNA_ID=CAMNT_0016189259 /DNA_START=48 /DNA_END=305 /DNA_ORIENTATION=+
MDHIDGDGVVWWAVANLLFRRTLPEGQHDIAVQWQVPQGGWQAEDFAEERVDGLEGFPGASWRPLDSFQPPLTAAVVLALPVFDP